MTYRERQRQLWTAKVWGVAITIIALSLALALHSQSLALAREQAYNAGYNDGYNTGRADGWQGCIEENNLYERYE